MSHIYAVHGVKPEDGNPDNLIRVSDEEAEFFTVYLRNADGTEDAVADYPSRQEAEEEIERYKAQASYSGESVNVLAVQNLDQFARLMVDWHTDGQKQIALASNPPKDVRIKATIRGREKVLSISERDAFIAGVQVAGAIFKNLPFQFVEQEIEQAVEGDTDA